MEGTGEARRPDKITRPLADLLAPSGLLWLINATTFHPRGFALALVTDDDGMIVGWQLQGDGREPWRYGEDVETDERFAAAEAAFAAARNVPPAVVPIEADPLLLELRSTSPRHRRTGD